MALNLKKKIIRSGVANGALVLGLALGLAWATGNLSLGLSLLWPVAMAAGVGGVSAWQTARKIKNSLLDTLARPVSYVRLQRDAVAGLQAADWAALDDYAVQLASRGFRPLGDFAVHPLRLPSPAVVSVFGDPLAATLVEVQRHADGAIHFSITSLVGGNIRVCTSDIAVGALNYLNRGDHDVYASYPGMGLFALMEKHEKVLGNLRQRTGKVPSCGLTMERYLLVIREVLRQAHARVSRQDAYEIARQVDAFEALPMTRWALSTEWLKTIPKRALEELDKTLVAGTQPLLMDPGASAGQAAPAAESAVAGAIPAATPSAAPSAAPVAAASAADLPDPTSAATVFAGAPAAAAIAADAAATQIGGGTASDAAPEDQLRARVAAGANWFYWIAALSLVNSVVAALGSDWVFAIGLGVSQLMSAMADEMASELAPLTLNLLRGAGIAACLFFAACGWISRRPSTLAFAVGMLAFALDSLIFIMVGDVVGIIFHALALYFLGQGLLAARQARLVTAGKATTLI